MTEIRVIKKWANGSWVLVPSLPEDQEVVANMKAATPYKLSGPKKERSGQHHRLFFALLNVVLQHTENFENVEQILHIVKLRLGHFDTLIEPKTGKTFLKPKSISFAKMNQDQFNKFYKEAVQVILTYFLPDWVEKDLEQATSEILEFA